MGGGKWEVRGENLEVRKRLNNQDANTDKQVNGCGADNDNMMRGNASEQPRDKCGVFAVCQCADEPNAAEVVYHGLQALQHRGQESAGISYRLGGDILSYKGMGLVNHCLSYQSLHSINTLTAIGHVRYSTSGASSLSNVQPMVAHSADGYKIAVVHNGNLSNSLLLWQNYREQGHIFQTSSDTEIILAFLFQNRHLGLAGAVQELMHHVEGAFSVIAMDNEELAAFRDPHGFRPLCIGTINDSYVFSSETCALDAVEASFLREIEPGEIVTVRNGTIKTHRGLVLKEAFCIFEYVYFARADSSFHDINVYQARKNIGRCLARQLNNNSHDCHDSKNSDNSDNSNNNNNRSMKNNNINLNSIDMIIPSPDSGNSAAIGLAEATGIPLEWAVYRNPYGGRTFINPGQALRETGVRLKFNLIASLVKGKRIALVDDSLVRGTTARHLTLLLKNAGAKSVHFFIAAPPFRFPCYYGIDIPIVNELATAETDPAELAASIGCDSITFNTTDDLFEGIGRDKNKFCSACFTGIYPVEHKRGADYYHC